LSLTVYILEGEWQCVPWSSFLISSTRLMMLSSIALYCHPATPLLPRSTEWSISIIIRAQHHDKVLSVHLSLSVNLLCLSFPSLPASLITPVTFYSVPYSYLYFSLCGHRPGALALSALCLFLSPSLFLSLFLPLTEFLSCRLFGSWVTSTLCEL
jgi:hypothetical protein